jgi:hypothetical protein
MHCRSISKSVSTLSRFLFSTESSINNSLARKMRCRYSFHKNSDKLHPFYQKTGYEPEFSCHTLENYINLTKFELSYLLVRKFHDNISKKERQSITNLKRNKQIIIKKAEITASHFLANSSKSFNNSSLAFLSSGFGMNFKPLDNKM